MDLITLETVKNALKEDESHFDETTNVLEIGHQKATALLTANEQGVFFGESILEALSSIFENKIEIKKNIVDGKSFISKQILLEISGCAGILLSIERTLLNFLSHLCAVTTLTSKFVEKTSHIKILPTRKTLPGLRYLQLKAVQAGGGVIHRRSLSDGILIKDNHLNFVSPKKALELAKKNKSPLHRIEMEIQSFKQLQELEGQVPDVIMLDNMELSELKKCIEHINRRCEIEISGGVTLENLDAFLALPIKQISMGCLTHSVKALDLSLTIR